MAVCAELHVSIQALVINSLCSCGCNFVICVEHQPNKDHKLLRQMDFDDNQQLNVRIVSTLSIGSFSTNQVRLLAL